MFGTLKATASLIMTLSPQTMLERAAKIDGPVSVRDMLYLPPLAPIVAPNSTVRAVSPSDDDNLFNNRPTAWFLVHNDSTSWMMFVPIMAIHWLEQSIKRNVGVYPVVFFHKIVHTLPVVREIASAIVGNNVTTYAGALDMLKSDIPYHMATCPEGSNCLFQYPDEVAPFQQYALIKAAIAAGSNLGVITFKQKKPLSFKVKIPFINWIKQDAIGLRVPYLWMIQNPIDVVYEHFPSPISSDAFAALTKSQQTQIVQDVGTQIRELMKLRLSQLVNGTLP